MNCRRVNPKGAQNRFNLADSPLHSNLGMVVNSCSEPSSNEVECGCHEIQHGDDDSMNVETLWGLGGANTQPKDPRKSRRIPGL